MDIDPTKAPRTYAAWKKAYDVQELAKFMVELSQQLEVELNTAIVNEAFAENKVYMLEKQLKQANERIKLLEEAYFASEALHTVRDCACCDSPDVWIRCSTCCDKIKRYHAAKANLNRTEEAKEAKP